MAHRDGCERSTMEGAGQRRGIKSWKPAVESMGQVYVFSAARQNPLASDATVRD
jgi:hypothetical protein